MKKIISCFVILIIYVTGMISAYSGIVDGGNNEVKNDKEGATSNVSVNGTTIEVEGVSEKRTTPVGYQTKNYTVTIKTGTSEDIKVILEKNEVKCIDLGGGKERLSVDANLIVKKAGGTALYSMFTSAKGEVTVRIDKNYNVLKFKDLDGDGYYETLNEVIEYPYDSRYPYSSLGVEERVNAVLNSMHNKGVIEGEGSADWNHYLNEFKTNGLPKILYDYSWKNFASLSYGYAIVVPLDLSAFKKNISVTCVGYPKKVYEGDSAIVTMQITYTPAAPAEPITAYWEVTDMQGKSLIDKSKYTNTDFDKSKTIIQSPGFTIPNGGAKIKFTLNPEGSGGIEEVNPPGYSDNSAEVTIGTIPYVEKSKTYTLDFDELSMKIDHSIMSNTISTSTLSLPQGTDTTQYSWFSDPKTSGALNVTKKEGGEYLHGYDVKNNEEIINSDVMQASRSPIVGFTLKREDFGDDPGKRWLANKSNPYTIYAKINYKGSIERPYFCNSRLITGKNEKGETTYSDWQYGGQGKATADFLPAGTDVLTFEARVYNGKETLTDNPDRKFRFGLNSTADNKDSVTQTIHWISDAHDIDVQRWMLLVNENHQPIGDPVAKDGQYSRRFTQQNMATITYQNIETIRGEYTKDRANSRQGIQNTEAYPHALFSTDKQLSRYEFPIKSGFYLNPVGKYKVTVKSVIYKKDDKYSAGHNTMEHKEIVDKVKESFKYRSNLTYTRDFRSNNYHLDYNQSNSPLKSLVSMDPNEIPGANFSGNEKLEVSTGPKDSTLDKRYKQILEGWHESLSTNTYNYIEYIKNPNLNIYKITETTEIIFDVNPKHVKCYIVPNLPNSKTQIDYYVRSWFDPITLNLKKDEIGHKQAITTKKVNLKDNSVNIVVMGSYYDQ
ncbi:MAG: hypothetical protein N2645_15025 [Clostridia bacterium]|nr:hypothetical protein [Clostridia bacterium]